MSCFASILAEYGDDAVVFTDGQLFNVRAFVNPIISDRYLKKWKAMTKLGEVDEATYYYFGPPDCNILDCDNSYVVCNGVTYQFIRAELFRVERVPSHWEAVLRIKEEVFNG